MPDDLEPTLRARLKGEVRFDSTSRLLYATDASLYQILPVGVVVPRDAEDVVETVRTAVERGVPLLPRGAGTSLAGQAVGAALVLDFTKFMNAVLEVNAEERWVRVQPGVVLDELNAWLRPHGLKFAPDVATSNRASIGGMMGNNSCGARSILYGKTLDHVLEQQAVLSDGSTAHFLELAEGEWRRRGKGEGLEARIYRETDRICRENAEEIERGYPRILRRVGGYNLDEYVRRGRRNLACFTVGSEGTLATVTEAKLRLVPVPKHAGLLVSHFTDLIASLEAAAAIIEDSPAAVELVDRIILDLTRDNLELAWARSFLQGDPDAVLVTEFYGNTAEEVAGRTRALSERLGRLGLGYAHVPVLDAPGQKNVWNVRKAGLGLLMGMKGDAKPAGFIEDTAVAPERLPDYIRDLRALLAEYSLDACYYAHASVGCLHVRPILNLKEPADVARMREIASRTADLVLRYGGAMSAEHGDGLVRSEWQERMFGPQLYRAFQELKAAWDPSGLMNPGKIVGAPHMDEHLRIRPAYKTAPVLTVLDFSADGGFARSVELCSGVGACRKKTDGTMCPSYRATLEEKHSTRGRANMLRLVLSGQADVGDSPGVKRQASSVTDETHDASRIRITHHGPDNPESRIQNPELADERLLDVLDLCLECKACKSECPSNVDMAKLKYEFLHHYHTVHGTPLRARIFGRADRMGRMGSALAPVANALLRQPAARALMERWAGIDRRRPLPPFAGRTFRAWFRRRVPPASARGRGEVLLLADTFTNYHEPEVGKAAVRVLEAFGYRVRVPDLRCCARPMFSKGLLQEAKANAEFNVRALQDPTARGVPLLGLEPSCLVTFRDEYRDLGLGEAAERVAENAWLLEDFLAERHAGESGLPFAETSRPVLLHGHCHQKAVLGTRRMLEALRMVPGYAVMEIPSGCCGMAGSFGYEKEHYEVSLKIGELSLFPHVRAAPEDALLVAPGTSCRHQIRDATGRTALHPAEALALALGAPDR